MHHARTALLICALLLTVVPAAAQLGCEIPLFVQEGSIDANVMILFDNSGSMNEAMYHPDYDHTVDWGGGYNNGAIYTISSTGYYNINGETARLVRSYNQNGRYSGNYLNWIFWHATDEQRDNLPQVCRIHVAQDVVADIIDRSERVRFGLTRFNTYDGGQVIAECGEDKDELIDTVKHIEGTTWTPLSETMEDILDYFKDTGDDAPILADCQKSFCIVITDGYPTKDRDVSGYLWDADGDGNDPGNCESIGSPDPNSSDCSDHLDDIAYYMANEDLRPDLEDDQHVYTYSIGFGIDASILGDTAHNGTGMYLLAENAVDLWTSLELVMLDIISRISTGAAVAVVSTERGDDERLYRGKFMPGSWHGYLESFALPYEDGDAPVWEAGNQLHQRDADDRTIYTGLGSNLMTFDSGQAGVLQGPLGALDIAQASNIIDWTRGEQVAGLRDRSGWKLGDIIHSTPVVVGPPSNFNEDPGYQSFMDAHASRTKMVYVGSNDGMLHAFEAETGHEAWAFVPEFALPDLATVADTSYCHQYTVDLTPTVRDCQLNGAWRTVLIGGGREGGSGYFALDVTDPHSPDLLWQVSLPNGKPFASQVEIAVVGGETVALIGSGLDESNGEAKVEVYAVDDGTHLGTAPLAVDAGRRNKATAPRAVDLDLDGEHDALYVADLQGHVWKFVFNGSSDPWSWDRYCLWEDTSKEISSPPTPAYGDGGSVNVYFGTGAYLEESDIATREDNIFGCIIDRQSGMQYASLHDQTDGIDDLTGADGWYLRLENQSGERVTEPAVVVAESVFFTSFVPSQEVCSAGGNSWLYRLDYRDASVPDDGESDDWDGNRSVDLDQGVASRPVVDVVNETVIVQSSDATITVQEIGQSYFHLRVRSWQESFDYVSAQPDSN